MRNKQDYYNEGAIAAAELRRQGKLDKEGYPCVYEGYGGALSGSWQAKAWREGFDAERERGLSLSLSETYEALPKPDPLTPQEEHIIAQAKAILQSRIRTGRQYESPAAVRDYFVLHNELPETEHFKIMWVDTQHRMLEVQTLGVGTFNQMTIYPREVVKSALNLNAGACFISHNHPSGTLEASRADIALTKKLREALDLIEVRLLDHIIVAGGDSMSFAEKGIQF